MNVVTSVESGSVLIAKPDCFFIDGAWVKPSSDAQIEVIAPATEEVFLCVAEAQEADVNRAVDAARAAFDQGPWPRMTPGERAGYLRHIQQGLTERVGDIAAMWPNEMGILHAAAEAFTKSIPSVYGYYADLADTFEWVEKHDLGGGETGLLVREPVGVVAIVIPWNGPISLIANKLAPALLAGCTVIIKAAPEAPTAAYVMAEICEKVGLPKGVVNVITAEREASELLVRHRSVDKISFTGSSAAGKRIASLCGERIARYTLELGGKSAAVILDDYDLEQAAEAISQSARLMTGQVCSALTRIIVNKNRHDDFVDALCASFGPLQIGSPFDPASEIGPVAMRRQRDRIEALIGRGRDEGGRVATGGGRPAGLNRGFFIEPTVFANVSNDSTIAREEIFGPVLSVIPADNEAHAVALANDTVYGLNNSVFTNDVERAYSVARQLRSGMVGHNRWRTEFSIAFGGFKESGVGREGGVEGLYPYTEAKTILLNSLPSEPF